MKLKLPVFSKLAFSDTHKSVGIFLLFVGLACFCFFIVFLPAFKQQRLLAQSILLEQRGLSKTQQLRNAEFLKIDTQVKEIKSKLEYARNTLLWEKDITNVLSVLTNLASGLEIEFVSLKPEAPLTVTQPVEKPDKKDAAVRQGIVLTQMPISVILKSDYDNLVEFLRRVEEGNKFIKIDSLNIEVGDAKLGKLLIVMMLDIFADEKSN